MDPGTEESHRKVVAKQKLEGRSQVAIKSSCQQVLLHRPICSHKKSFKLLLSSCFGLADHLQANINITQFYIPILFI